MSNSKTLEIHVLIVPNSMFLSNELKYNYKQGALSHLADTSGKARGWLNRGDSSIASSGHSPSCYVCYERILGDC